MSSWPARNHASADIKRAQGHTYQVNTRTTMAVAATLIRYRLLHTDWLTTIHGGITAHARI